MAIKTMRENKDGGVSYCSAPEEKVGMRRCNHVPGSVKFNVEVNNISKGLKEVVISEDYDKLDEGDRIEVIKEFASTLEPINKKTLNKVLDQLSKMS